MRDDPITVEVRLAYRGAKRGASWTESVPPRGHQQSGALSNILTLALDRESVRSGRQHWTLQWRKAGSGSGWSVHR